MLYRDEAIVLRTHKLGEADRIITLLTRQHGRVRAVAKGVRRTTSKFGSRLEPFTHVDLQLAEGRSLDTITQAETRGSYAAAVGADYERYTAGTAMLETAERLVVEEREPAVQQFLLLLGALKAMASGERRPGHVLDSYLLRSLAVAGYAPACVDCAHCGRAPGRPASPLVQPVDGRRALRDLPDPGLRQPRARDLGAAGWPARRRLAGRRGRRPRHLREASGLIAAFVQWQLERGLRSLAYVER